MKFKKSGGGMGRMAVIVVFGSLSRKCLSENRFIAFFRQALLISKYLSHQIVILGSSPSMTGVAVVQQSHDKANLSAV